jgi:hypothetical protein
MVTRLEPAVVVIVSVTEVVGGTLAVKVAFDTWVCPAGVVNAVRQGGCAHVELSTLTNRKRREA